MPITVGSLATVSEYMKKDIKEKKRKFEKIN